MMSNEYRAKIIAVALRYITSRKITYRSLCKEFNLSCYMVNRYLHTYLPLLSPRLYRLVKRKIKRTKLDSIKRIKKINYERKNNKG